MNGSVDRRLRFSVIIPAWNDAENLDALLPELAKIDADIETTVVNAGQDRQRPNNQRWQSLSESETSAANGRVTFLPAPRPNRGEQMNRGATAASGDVFIFHHADSQLTAAHFSAIEEALRDPEIIGGAFHRKFDTRHPRLRFLERVARFRARHGGTLFGDQSIFIRREVFARLGGFATIPLMEDVEFSRRLRAAGRLAIVDPPVQSSARRHLERGAWRASVQNGLFIALYKLGVSPHRLHRWYYGETA
ncbi:MAG TPA: TIGR04283 family arsenosugar biosynthesis glycosyltransferase [Chthoniobacterales bacterium]|nr:TIGR04283 family arsenosugar biosynthesis glycosyltransferase [Chthoniobacterales bacterium]